MFEPIPTTLTVTKTGSGTVTRSSQELLVKTYYRLSRHSLA